MSAYFSYLTSRGVSLRRRFFIFILLLLLPSLACSLLATPPRPIIPTPIPTAPPLAVQLGVPEEMVLDPVSNVVPKVDPEIARLVNLVSRQNLMVYVQTLEGFRTRNTFSTVDRQDFGIGAARLFIFNELARVGSGRLQVQFDNFALPLSGIQTQQQNVVAILPGTSPHAGVVVLSAHYDSRTFDPNDGESVAPGANDNASGVAVLIETARLLSSQTWNQTIVFVAFAAEEQGRHGSRYFVSDRLLAGWTIDAVFNNDIVGGRPGIPQAIRVFAPGPDNSEPLQLARYMNLISGIYLPTFLVDLQQTIDREGRYSDHISFLDAGVPALRLTESQEDFNSQHSSFDTSEKLDYNYLMQVTQLNLVTVANIIGAPPKPPAPLVAPMADPGAYILTWSPDPLAAGYALSFRPLGTSEYPPFRFVNGPQAGNVALTGFDPLTTYAVSIAAIDQNGRISLFSPEILVGP